MPFLFRCALNPFVAGEQADGMAVLQHRERAEPLFGHQRQALRDCVRGRGEGDAIRHGFADRRQAGRAAADRLYATAWLTVRIQP